MHMSHVFSNSLRNFLNSHSSFFEDAVFIPPTGVESFGMERRISFVWQTLWRLSNFVGEDALHEALNRLVSHTIPDFHFDLFPDDLPE